MPVRSTAALCCACAHQRKTVRTGKKDLLFPAQNNWAPGSSPGRSLRNGWELSRNGWEPRGPNRGARKKDFRGTCGHPDRQWSGAGMSTSPVPVQSCARLGCPVRTGKRDVLIPEKVSSWSLARDAGPTRPDPAQERALADEGTAGGVQGLANRGEGRATSVSSGPAGRAHVPPPSRPSKREKEGLGRPPPRTTLIRGKGIAALPLPRGRDGRAAALCPLWL